MVKRIKDGRKVMMGQINTGTYGGNENKIQLFDGKFTTGYRIVSFRIAPQAPTGSYEILAKLSTETKSVIYQWDWGDVEELAWAGWNISNSATDLLHTNVREENMAIEDLWISSYTTGEAIIINYEIVLDKYEFTAWDGAATLVRNQSQSG